MHYKNCLGFWSNGFFQKNRIHIARGCFTVDKDGFCPGQFHRVNRSHMSHSRDQHFVSRSELKVQRRQMQGGHAGTCADRMSPTHHFRKSFFELFAFWPMGKNWAV